MISQVCLGLENGTFTVSWGNFALYANQRTVRNITSSTRLVGVFFFFFSSRAERSSSQPRNTTEECIGGIVVQVEGLACSLLLHC